MRIMNNLSALERSASGYHTFVARDSLLQHKDPIVRTHSNARFMGKWLVWLLIPLIFSLQYVMAAGNALESVSSSALSNDKVQISLQFTGPAPEPLAFTIDNPARIALDFQDTANHVSPRLQPVDLGIIRSVNTAESNGRTRVVMNLARLAGYQTEIVSNKLLLTIDAGADTGSAFALPASRASSAVARSESASTFSQSSGNSVTTVDFRRGEQGQGRVLIGLSNPEIPVNLIEQGGRIVLDIIDARLPDALRERLNVVDFATPVQTIEAYSEGGNTRIVISPNTALNFEHLAYQSDNLYVVEVSEIPVEVAERRKKEVFEGEKLSLNFQDIEVRSVLQLIADFTGLNIVVSDTVGGNLTLRLKNVPWDQALDIILKTKGLDKRQTGNVLLIAPSEEIAAREKLELESNQQVQELAPLRSEFIQVNYARAADLAALLKASENSLLSARGNVAIDERTNTLLVQDTATKLDEVRNLVERLDIPVRQVLIESRIVIATDDFSKELGVRFGVSNFDSIGPGESGTSAITGNLDGATDFINGDDVQLADTLNVNLPVVNPAGSIGLALAKLPLGLLLELELSAAQAESRAEVISNPRVITSNQATARIEQGTEIPYQSQTSSGATDIEFKKAVLSLEVTPQITPDDRVAMQLSINSDSVGQIFAGVPSIDTREVTTQVLVDNGQTVVLGGVYQEDSTVSNSRVPFFSDIPLLGRLFRTDLVDNGRSELLVFITPRIINDKLSLAR